MATNADLTAQVIALNDKLNLAMQRVADLENSRVHRDETKQRGGIGDKEILRPDKLVRQTVNNQYEAGIQLDGQPCE